MGYKEKKIIDGLILSCDEWSRLFRSNAGRAWAGKIIDKGDGWIKLKNPRVFHGLPKGFSDLFGIESVVITEDMIGKRVAIFKAIEVKTGNITVTEKQSLFGAMVEKLGGIFEVVRE